MTVGQSIAKSRPNLMCLLETKLSVVNDLIVKEVWGPRTSS